jgi:hypothetical protein
MLPEILDRSVTLVLNLVRKYWLKLLIFGGVWFVTFSAWDYYHKSLSKSITVLCDVRGSSSWRSAPDVVEKISATERVPGINFRARQESIADADDLESRIKKDTEGRSIGFTVDHGHQIPGMATLVPLDYDFLHVLCSHRFIVQHKLVSPYSIRDVLRILTSPGDSTAGSPLVAGLQEPLSRAQSSVNSTARPVAAGRVFAGPQNCACRQLAESVYSRCGYRSVQMWTTLHHGLNDWEQARAALKTGDIDLMFYLGPLGAKTIENIAVDDCCAALVSLDDIQGAIVADPQDMLLWPVNFPKNAYSSREYDYNGEKLYFCEDKLKTVAVRRLLVCSENVPPIDAYKLANAATTALKSDSPAIGDWTALPTGLSEKSLQSNLKATMQTGADTVPAEWWAPWTWPPFWASITLTFLGVVILRILPKSGELKAVEASDGGRPKPSDGDGQQQVSPSMPQTIDGVFQQEDTLLREWLSRLEHSGELDSAAWEDEKQKVQSARQRVRTLADEQKINADEAAQLRGIIRNLKDELDWLKPLREKEQVNLPLGQGDGDLVTNAPRRRTPRSTSAGGDGSRLRRRQE